MSEAVEIVSVRTVVGEVIISGHDHVAVEEPLRIQVWHGPLTKRVLAQVGTTMRTPGHDTDLVAGFLFTDRSIHQAADVLDIKAVQPNVVRVTLHPDVPWHSIKTRGTIHSSCGVCGRKVIEDLEMRLDQVPPCGELNPNLIHQLSQRLREAQPAFDRTGGLHAAALFDLSGELLLAREDVGRHNAVDKVIGAEFRAGRVPLRNRLLFVSGRASFELVQKAVAAGATALAAVGAPSSLAVELARRFGLTLIGFVRDLRFNVYTAEESPNDG